MNFRCVLIKAVSVYVSVFICIYKFIHEGNVFSNYIIEKFIIKTFLLSPCIFDTTFIPSF